ncbi:glycerate kinase [Anaerosphaera multitolerans]|uniref:Glycerate kinase n=1 Tax=Anaerosphaera multitolerans TaxID=2487351 RepID=A0A437S8D3_9FIRM|nr:glycerate kinase [Anaerosphaera multitolerans]RVU55087.1 glycerate kinase [Anaerosphaera multitolerans]
MKVLIAMDSFKGSLSSIEAGNAVRRGIERLNRSDIEVKVRQIADGGEGTMETLVEELKGEYVTLDVTGPLGQRVSGRYGIIQNNVAVVEIAQAAGITLTDSGKLDPLNATTYGVGEMIRDAVDRGCRDFIVGLGGSATVDGGTGMLKALGYKFLKKDGSSISKGIKELDLIESISCDEVPNEIRECTFKIASDVNNFLLGKEGAIAVFGPQKGVKKEEVKLFESKMTRFAEKTVEYLGIDNRNLAGAGAAGGLGFAFCSYLNSNISSGIEIILNILNLESDIKNSDIVITGEGKLDGQTAMGKVPVGISKLSKKYNKKVIAFAGAVEREARKCNSEGIDAFFPILREVVTLEEALNLREAKLNLEDSVEQVFNLLYI